jgi:hypothetical protein
VRGLRLSTFLATTGAPVLCVRPIGFTGVNYYLIAVVEEEGEYRIAEMSDAPIEALRPKGIGFNSEAEGAALEKLYERYPELRPD